MNELVVPSAVTMKQPFAESPVELKSMPHWSVPEVAREMLDRAFPKLQMKVLAEEKDIVGLDLMVWGNFNKPRPAVVLMPWDTKYAVYATPALYLK